MRAAAGRSGRRGGTALARGQSGGVLALLVVVAALAAIAEVVAGRPAPVVSEPPSVLAPGRASSTAALLRLGDEARARGDVPAARRAYLAGLFRARGERSLPDLVWAAEGFAALGDHAVVAEALAMAAPLAAAADEATRRRLAALRAREDPAISWRGAP